jgi:hypothetical protein
MHGRALEMVKHRISKVLAKALEEGEYLIYEYHSRAYSFIDMLRLVLC